MSIETDKQEFADNFEAWHATAVEAGCTIEGDATREKVRNAWSGQGAARTLKGEYHLDLTRGHTYGWIAGRASPDRREFTSYSAWAAAAEKADLTVEISRTREAAWNGDGNLALSRDAYSKGEHKVLKGQYRFHERSRGSAWGWIQTAA